MKPINRFMSDMLDFELSETSSDVLWRACKPVGAAAHDGVVILSVPFAAQKHALIMQPEDTTPWRLQNVAIRAYGDAVIRVTLACEVPIPGNDNVMLEWHPELIPEPLDVRATPSGWDVVDTQGLVRLRINTKDESIRQWSNFMPPPPQTIDMTVIPDGKVEVPFMTWDMFSNAQVESLPLAYVERDHHPFRTLFSLHARHDEKFAGTGERFTGMNLAGHTFLLENVDALGVNNRRAYKNIPFYVSSKMYGLLVLTSAHMRLSLADVSTRAAQGMVEDKVLDLFFIGGGSIERIVRNYRCLTGFPRNVPVWSYGTWMSRMSYWTAEQTQEVARKLREGEFPSDVIHLDTGWFNEDWVCDWEFSRDKYPDPSAYMRGMREKGFRISLWQRPSIGRNNRLFDEAMTKGYIVGPGSDSNEAMSYNQLEYTAPIDFSNPEAVRWYQDMLAKLLALGASVIKTDFGEEIDMSAAYHGMPARMLHNLYALLYQKAAYEITQKMTGQGIIWARASWIGCQRYPVHWGGDTGCTWDGMAGTLRGGLHLGVSGFAFWSYDVPGFHGVPNFMNSWPANDLLVRWTQMAVFGSHIRYHGAQPREPYEYPEIADILRQWWRLRYALIPYLVEQGTKCTKSGLPVLRALIFHNENDPMCWAIDDEFYCGDSLLVAPVMNSEGLRDIYLPAGDWINIWSGQELRGPQWLHHVKSPLDRMPVYAVKNAVIAVYPNRVQCTDEIVMNNVQRLQFDDAFRGLAHTVLGSVMGISA